MRLIIKTSLELSQAHTDYILITTVQILYRRYHHIVIISIRQSSQLVLLPPC